jgi:predicted Zn-dependent peptidase
VQEVSSNRGFAVQLAQQQALSGDWRDLFTKLDKIDAVTAADIQRIAQKKFVPANMTVGLVEPCPTHPSRPRAPARRTRRGQR